jgi:hypothetical protein
LARRILGSFSIALGQCGIHCIAHTRTHTLRPSAPGVIEK